jgi:putative transposase
MNFELVDQGPKAMTVRARCEALGVTEQGYYAFCTRREAPAAHVERNVRLADAIAVAHAVGRESYGTPRLKTELARHGITASRRRIGRIRDSLGLSVRARRAFVCTTNADSALAASPNLLDRAFVATEINTVWVSDITFLTAGAHWLYLCTIIDCYSGAIVGRKLSRAIDAQLVRDTLAMAVRTRQPPLGCLFHSDRGSQYASAAFRADLAAGGLTQSMSRRANCWDNAVAESSFGRLKTELGDTFADELQAKNAVYDYIDVFYNMIRIHSRHNMAPLNFEHAHTSN